MSKKKRRHHKKKFQPIAFHESLAVFAPEPASLTLQMPFLEESLAIGYDIFSTWARPRLEIASLYTVATWHDTRMVIRPFFAAFKAKRLIIAFVLLSVIGASGTGVFAYRMAQATIAKYQSQITSPNILLNVNRKGTTITDRDGQILYQGYGATEQVPVKIDDLPPALIQATLAAEDPSFYDHAGFSWKGTARAIFEDIKAHGKVQGGSTITQQLIKNSLLTSQKSYQRKFEEIVMSVVLEQRYSKRQILEMYLNKVYYGQGSYGVGSAAQTYFHKNAKDLTLDESALLAGLPLGPSRFDPSLSPSAAKARRDFVLEEMVGDGFITTAQSHAATAKTVTGYERVVAIKSPHFVFYVLSELRRLYGDKAVEEGGILVKTSLSSADQALGERLVAEQVARISAAHHATNGGLISLDPKTGDILAMVGSIDYNYPGFGSVNVTTSKLQPGSSFKPIGYAAAMKKGWNGATLIDDSPFQITQPDGTIYRPADYDGRFRGKVLLRRALGNSLNIPALHAIQFAGIESVISTASDLGITTLGDSSNYGISLILGSAEVKPLDMAAVYATFATGGLRVSPNGILQVLDRNGKDITKPRAAAVQVLDPRIVGMLTDILSDNNARIEEFGPNSPLKLSRPVAAKTGTTNDFRDNWTVGYTPNLVTAVWVGNNDHTPMISIDGITGAAPIWHDYMEAVLASMPLLGFEKPAGLVQLQICASDGGLANPWDPKTGEWFITDNLPTKQCSTKEPAKPADPAPIEPIIVPIQSGKPGKQSGFWPPGLN